MFKKLFGTRHAKVWGIVTAAVIVVAIVLNIVCFTVVSKVFDNLWGGDTSSGRGEGGVYTLDEGITDKKSAQANGNAVSEEICEEGFVLLKNAKVGEAPALPLATTSSAKKKVSVFGKNSVNLVYGGSGSGAGNTEGAKSIYDSLTAANYEYNGKLKAFYDDNNKSGTGRPASLDIEAGIPSGFSTGETPVSSYENDKELTDSFSEYKDMAIVVISRTCGEGNDVPLTMKDEKGGKLSGAYDENDHYLELDKNEQDMLKMVCEAGFDRVVLVINSSQTMELGFLDDITDGDDTMIDYDFASGIDAAVWIGGPGASGIMALGRILNGEVNPSGRTVDTYSRDFTQLPVYPNLMKKGSDDMPSDMYYKGSTSSPQNVYYSDYEEGIYIGYRYFETRAAEMNEDAAGSGDEWYKNNVVYPFGYGLSYTTFDWSADTDSLDNGVIEKDSTITVNVNVKNTGNVAGKDVVQLYARTPYTDGEIEKADKVLVAFGKTDTLDAKTGEGTVSLTFDAYDLASYDSLDANKNGFKGYELEAGDYTFFISTDAHTAVDEFTMKVTSDIRYKTSVEGGAEVVNRFDDVDDQLGQQLSRADFEGTFPEARTADERIEDDAFFAEVNSFDTNNPITDDSDEVKNADLSYSTKKVSDGITLIDLVGADYDDEDWDELLAKMTLKSMHEMRELTAYGTAAADFIKKPKTIDADGPVGFTQFMGGGNEVTDTCMYPSEPVLGSTFNVALAEKMGKAIGNEALIGDGNDPYTGWYAPGLNLHRSPFGGRNYEYYSEDVILSGKMGANVIKGAWSKGVCAYMKHFAVNEQETHRTGVCTWITEQTMREIYLKAFEIAVTEDVDSAKGVMSSFNRLGTLWAGGDYRLLTEVLRNEWGFVGCVISDFSVGLDYMSSKQMAYAGGDLNLTNIDTGNWVDKNSKTDIYVVKNCIKNFLYMLVNSNAMNGMGADYKTHLATWKVVVIIIDVAVFVGLAVWGVFAILGSLRKSKQSVPADTDDKQDGGSDK